MGQLSHPYMTTGKTIVLTIQTFISKVMSLFSQRIGQDWVIFTFTRFVIAFLPRDKQLLISLLQSLSAVILDPKKIKLVTVSIFSLSICHQVMGPNAMILVFWTLSFKPAFSLSYLTFIKRLFSFSLLSAIRVVSSVYLRLMIFLRESWFQLVLHLVQHFTWCTLHIGYISWVIIYSLDILLSHLEPVCCSMSGSSCCCWTCIQNSQEAG